MKKLYIFALAIGTAAPALAQDGGLADMPMSSLNGEVQRRYDDALATTQDPVILSSIASNFTWASEAKVQCGIALGFLKSNTRDRDSLSKCEKYHAMMTKVYAPAPVAIPAPPPPVRNSVCDTPLLTTIFFDWDSSVPTGDADQSVAFITANRADCGWQNFNVIGHTDRSGSDKYNDSLSLRRASAIADLMRGAGIADTELRVSGRGESEPKVDTPDGERNPTNRRVEITAN